MPASDTAWRCAGDCTIDIDEVTAACKRVKEGDVRHRQVINMASLEAQISVGDVRAALIGRPPRCHSEWRRTQGRLTMLKLYSGDLSPFSARVRMQIYAKGITDIALERPAHFGLPKFREEFPIGRIPILDVDGDVIPESDVIAEYLEEVFPEPSMLGATPRETAHIRLIARIGDIYIMNNMFMLSPQTRAASRNEGVVELLGGQVVRNIKALDQLIGTSGFACFNRLTMADCALVPGLFLVENVLHLTGVDNPIPAHGNVAAYWEAIQKNEHAAKTLEELHRGLEERRRMIRDGSFQRFMAAAAS